MQKSADNRTRSGDGQESWRQPKDGRSSLVRQLSQDDGTKERVERCRHPKDPEAVQVSALPELEERMLGRLGVRGQRALWTVHSGIP